MQCAGYTITAHKSVKYLGIEIDQHVSGEEVAKYVICKANTRLKLSTGKNIWTATVVNFFGPHSFNACLIISLVHGVQASVQPQRRELIDSFERERAHSVLMKG